MSLSQNDMAAKLIMARDFLKAYLISNAFLELKLGEMKQLS